MADGELINRGTDLRDAHVITAGQCGEPWQPPAGLVVHQRRGDPVREHPSRRLGQLTAWRGPAGLLARNLPMWSRRPPAPGQDRSLVAARHVGQPACRRGVASAPRPVTVAPARTRMPAALLNILGTAFPSPPVVLTGVAVVVVVSTIHYQC